MKTLILTPTVSGEDGLSCLTRQVTAVMAQSSAVEVLSLADARSVEFPASVRLVGCAGSRPRLVWHAVRAASGVLPNKVIVMHAHLLPLAIPFAERRVPIVPVVVGVESWRRFGLLQQRAVRHAPRVIAISKHTAREFRRANPSCADVPVSICWPAAPDVAAAHSDSRRPAPFALIVGRLAAEERYKGHDLLIDVWPEVIGKVPQARLVVAGTGDDESRLRERVTAAGLQDAIEFVGFQTRAELAALYRDSAFLVMPSRAEGFGFVFLEAMAAGKACIGGRGAAEEIIVADTTGLIVDPKRSADVIAAIVRLFEQPALGRQMGEQGRIRAREVFSFERFARELTHATC